MEQVRTTVDLSAAKLLQEAEEKRQVGELEAAETAYGECLALLWGVPEDDDMLQRCMLGLSRMAEQEEYNTMKYPRCSRLIKRLNKERNGEKDAAPWVLFRLADAYLRRGDSGSDEDLAEADLQEAHRLYLLLCDRFGYGLAGRRKRCLYTLALRKARGKDYCQSTELFEQAMAVTDRHLEELEKLEPYALCVCGDIYLLNQNYEAAAKAYDRAMQGLPEEKGESYYSQKGRILQCMSKLPAEQPQRYLELLEEAAGCFQTVKNAGEEMLCWRIAARKMDEAALPEKSVECQTRAAHILEEKELLNSEDACTLAEIYTFRGLSYYRMENYDAEMADYEKAIELRKEVGSYKENLSDLAIIYCNCADTCLRQDKPAEAEAFYRRAEELLLALPEDKSLEKTESLARLYYEEAEHYKGRPDKLAQAETLYTKAIGAYQSAAYEKKDSRDLKEFLALCYNGRGVCHYAAGNYQEEINDCERALEIRKNMEQSAGNLAQIAVLLRNRADCHEMLERFDRAEQDYDEAIKLYITLEQSADYRLPLLEMVDLLICCARICDERERYAAAIQKYSSALRRMDEDTAVAPEDKLEYYGLCYFRRGMDYCKCEEHLYSLGMQDYCRAKDSLEQLPTAARTAELIALVLRTRGDLYSAMGEHDLAEQDFLMAQNLLGQEKDGETTDVQEGEAPSYEEI